MEILPDALRFKVITKLTITAIVNNTLGIQAKIANAKIIKSIPPKVIILRTSITVIGVNTILEIASAVI